MALETPDLPSQNQFSPKVFKLPNCKKTVSVLQCQATPEYLSSMLPLQSFSKEIHLQHLFISSRISCPYPLHTNILCKWPVARDV